MSLSLDKASHFIFVLSPLFFPEECCTSIVFLLWWGKAGLVGGNAVKMMDLGLLIPDVDNLGV